MVNYSKQPLKLKHSERFLIARRIDPKGNPVEFGVTVSYTTQSTPSFDVTRELNHEESDAFYTQDAQEALLVYNAIVQGER